MLNMPQYINIFDSQTEEYHPSFQTFLNHTCQKQKTKQWLNQMVSILPSWRIFIDAGAGNGAVTAWFADAFDRTIAIEANESLRTAHKNKYPRIEVLSEGILKAAIADSGDFVLCSHVFYHIDEADWLRTLLNDLLRVYRWLECRWWCSSTANRSICECCSIFSARASICSPWPGHFKVKKTIVTR
jgi:SAM-dependent methyltransferase